MTRAELEEMARTMNLSLEEAAQSLGETSLLRGPPPMRQFNPSMQTERSMRGKHPPPLVPSPPATPMQHPGASEPPQTPATPRPAVAAEVEPPTSPATPEAKT